MSYDLIFLPREPGQSWDDALDAAEIDPEEDSDETLAVDSEVWRAAVEGVRRVHPVVIERGDELLDEEASIQIQCWAREASISVPYWFTGEAARSVVLRMYAYAAAVERVTGLEGYDPQLRLAIADAAAHVDDAVKAFDQVAEPFRSRGIRS
jgi:hypothetical protein